MPKQIGDMVVYSVVELSKKLEITMTTIRTYIKTGKLKGQKIGNKYYITEEAIKELFNGKPKGE